MKKAIIFDFNRTLYDPSGRQLIDGAVELLIELRKAGLSLYLLSTAALSRKLLIGELGIADFFEETVISKNKNLESMKKLISLNGIDIQKSFVVGDRVRKEIKYGNLLGLRTIWFKQGKFESELPRIKEEEPDFVAQQIADVFKIIETN